MGRQTDIKIARYRDFVSNNNLPFYYHPEWLDIMSGNATWDVVLVVDSNDTVVGAWPFQFGRRWKFLPVIHPPLLCPQLGPWIIYPENAKIATRYDLEWKILSELADQLPKNIVAAQSKAPYRLRNWLPLEQKGWRQTTRYSYVYPREWSKEKRWRAMAGRQRTTVRKAKAHLKIDTSPKIQEVYRMLQLSFKYRGDKLSLPLATLCELDVYLRSSQRGTPYTVIDSSQRAHAAGYLAWDQHSLYNLIQGSDPTIRASGAAAFGIWWAGAMAADRDLAFDFEGSHLPGVELFYRGFGGELKEYYQFSKGIFLIS